MAFVLALAVTAPAQSVDMRISNIFVRFGGHPDIGWNTQTRNGYRIKITESEIPGNDIESGLIFRNRLRTGIAYTQATFNGECYACGEQMKEFKMDLHTLMPFVGYQFPDMGYMRSYLDVGLGTATERVTASPSYSISTIQMMFRVGGETWVSRQFTLGAEWQLLSQGGSALDIPLPFAKFAVTVGFYF